MSLSVDSIIIIRLQIDQAVEEDWPLTLISHKNEKLKIYLHPGEMLLYESAKVPHGRQFPLKGSYFDNLFVHFYPIGCSKKNNFPYL